MARYTKAFEAWYAEQVRTRGLEFDTIIIRMRDNRQVKTLAEGERRLRKMLALEFWIRTTAAKTNAELAEIDQEELDVWRSDTMKNG